MFVLLRTAVKSGQNTGHRFPSKHYPQCKARPCDRLDAKVLDWLRRTAEKKGLSYQSLVNQIWCLTPSAPGLTTISDRLSLVLSWLKLTFTKLKPSFPGWSSGSPEAKRSSSQSRESLLLDWSPIPQKTNRAGPGTCAARSASKRASINLSRKNFWQRSEVNPEPCGYSSIPMSCFGGWRTTAS